MLIALGVLLFFAIPAAAALWVARVFFEEFRPGRITILCYHRLISRADAEAGRVPDDEMIWVVYDTSFAEQMNLLRDKGWATLDLDDLVRIRSGEMKAPDRAVITTFDDGYRSNYTLAYPALAANSQRATIFVALEPDAHSRELVVGVDDWLEPAQLEEMSKHGISIQSHTLTHCILTEQSDEVVARELAESRRRLEAVTGQPVRHFAFPRGGHDARVQCLVAEAGYLTACGSKKGTATASSDLLALPRIGVERDLSLAEFERLLTPLHSTIHRIMGTLKLIPTRVLGASAGYALRTALYSGPLQPLFRPARLKKILAAAVLAYAAAGFVFALYLAGF